MNKGVDTWIVNPARGAEADECDLNLKSSSYSILAGSDTIFWIPDHGFGQITVFPGSSATLRFRSHESLYYGIADVVRKYEDLFTGRAPLHLDCEMGTLNWTDLDEHRLTKDLGKPGMELLLLYDGRIVDRNDTVKLNAGGRNPRYLR